MIDDKLELRDFENYGTVLEATGWSYCQPVGQSENSQCQSTDSHGIIMDNVIAPMNTWPRTTSSGC